METRVNIFKEGMITQTQIPFFFFLNQVVFEFLIIFHSYIELLIWVMHKG